MLRSRILRPCNLALFSLALAGVDPRPSPDALVDLSISQDEAASRPATRKTFELDSRPTSRVVRKCPKPVEDVAMELMEASKKAGIGDRVLVGRNTRRPGRTEARTIQCLDAKLSLDELGRFLRAFAESCVRVDELSLSVERSGTLALLSCAVSADSAANADPLVIDAVRVSALTRSVSRPDDNAGRPLEISFVRLTKAEYDIVFTTKDKIAAANLKASFTDIPPTVVSLDAQVTHDGDKYRVRIAKVDLREL